MRDIYGFLHVYTSGDWRKVVTEIMATCRCSGLYDVTKKIYVGVVGEESETFEYSDPKVEFIVRNKDSKGGERLTLIAMREFIGTLDDVGRRCCIWYAHTKGVTRGGNPCVSEWRRYLSYFVIERYADCLSALSKHSAVGVDWHEKRKIFSGNFWWARGEYVNALVALEKSGDRMDAEKWIGTRVGRTITVDCLHKSYAHLYKCYYPRERYERSSRGVHCRALADIVDKYGGSNKAVKAVKENVTKDLISFMRRCAIYVPNECCLLELNCLSEVRSLVLQEQLFRDCFSVVVAPYSSAEAIAKRCPARSSVCVPMLADDGMAYAVSLGLIPDLVYLHCDNLVTEFIPKCHETFPTTVLMGDRYTDKAVKEAVDGLAKDSVLLETFKDHWCLHVGGK